MILVISRHLYGVNDRFLCILKKRTKWHICILNSAYFFLFFCCFSFNEINATSIYAFSSFPFGFEGRMWDLIVSVPDHCLSFYF